MPGNTLTIAFDFRLLTRQKFNEIGTFLIHKNINIKLRQTVDFNSTACLLFMHKSVQHSQLQLYDFILSTNSICSSALSWSVMLSASAICFTSLLNISSACLSILERCFQKSSLFTVFLFLVVNFNI